MRRKSPVRDLGNRHEEAQAPGDDFRSEAERLQLRHSAIGIAGELDAMRAHHQGAADLQIAGEIEDGAAIEHGAPGFEMESPGALSTPKA